MNFKDHNWKGLTIRNEVVCETSGIDCTYVAKIDTPLGWRATVTITYEKDLYTSNAGIIKTIVIMH